MLENILDFVLEKRILNVIVNCNYFCDVFDGRKLTNERIKTKFQYNSDQKKWIWEFLRDELIPYTVTLIENNKSRMYLDDHRSLSFEIQDDDEWH